MIYCDSLCANVNSQIQAVFDSYIQSFYIYYGDLLYSLQTLDSAEHVFIPDLLLCDSSNNQGHDIVWPLDSEFNLNTCWTTKHVG